MAKKKVLLMGKAHSGKTSMRSIIFANYLARDTMRLSPTLDVEQSHVRFLGDLVLNLWDCGGQDAFYESYFERDRETIFRSVELLIYVFDIESDCPEKDFDHFAGVLEAIEENSPDARIFVLVHKMDLVAEEEREMILEDRRRLIEASCIGCGVHNFHCFGTSIWDETLYKAWSEIVTNLIPNISVLKSHLDDFCRICDADEVVLFEKATFLVISNSQASNNDTITYEPNLSSFHDKETNNNNSNDIDEDGAEIASSISDAQQLSINGGGSSMVGEVEIISENNPQPSVYSEITGNGADDNPISNNNGKGAILNNNSNLESKNSFGGGEDDANGAASNNENNNLHFDAHRFEKISNIVKQFKLSCGKAQSHFQGMEVSNSRFTAFIDAFTANTYIMVIVSNPDVHTAATLLNIKNARRHFERFIPRS